MASGFIKSDHPRRNMKLSIYGKHLIPGRLLQYLARGSRHHGTLGGRVLALEVVTHLAHGHPLNALVLVDIFDDTLEVSRMQCLAQQGG